jgi:bla regulator protein BlaR1
MNRITGAMPMPVLRGLSFLLPAVLFVTLVTPVGLGQATKTPDWQTAAGGTMAFEVASIRLSKPGEFTPPNFPLSSDDAYGAMGGNFTADFPLWVYIDFAYKLWLSPEQRKAMQANLPKWVATDAYEIHAKGPVNATKDQMRLMVQSLLAERFKLAVHFENHEVAVLAMTLIKPGKTGPKLTPHVDICDHDAPPPGKEAMMSDVFPPPCSGGSFMASTRPNHEIIMGSRGSTMAMIANSLPSIARLGRPVVDQTGLTGRYDFSVQWTMESNQPASVDAAPEPQGTTFLEAVKDQLGVKLEPAKVTMNVLVVDHVERPSEN